MAMVGGGILYLFTTHQNKEQATNIGKPVATQHVPATELSISLTSSIVERGSYL